MTEEEAYQKGKADGISEVLRELGVAESNGGGWSIIFRKRYDHWKMYLDSVKTLLKEYNNSV